MNYRREIDGLRALAVIPVILFHAGFQIFNGGFAGVDIFFVISGYLITSIILAEINKGQFSIIKFYERRARRILPALFFMLLVCIPFAWFWLIPSDFKHFFKSLRYVSLFLSNILFYRQSGYFDSAAELKPLLHTWSLGVEEQYYVLFPLLLIALSKWAKRLIPYVFLIIIFSSLAYAQHIVAIKPNVAFFLLQSRIWELLIGAIAANYLYNKKSDEHENGLINQSLSTLGLILILYALLGFNRETPSSSVWMLIPTIGSALVIIFTTQKTLVGKILGAQPLVGVGLISYSAYLWHQPLFAFARHRSLTEPSQLLFGILAILTLGFSYLSWKYIETPFRNNQTIKRKAVFMLAFAFSLLFVIFALVGEKNDGFVSRDVLFQKIAKIKTVEDNPCDKEVTKSTQQNSQNNLCILGNKSDPTFAIIGDSHAAALFESIRKYPATDPFAFYAFSDGFCPPIIGFKLNKYQNRDCQDKTSAAFQQILKSKTVKDVVLVAEWANYTKGYRGGTSDLNNAALASDELGTSTKPSDNQIIFQRGLIKTVQLLHDAGKNIILVEPVPEFSKDVFRAVLKEKMFNKPPYNFPTIPLREYNSRNKEVFESFQYLKAITFIKTSKLFCSDTECISVNNQGEIMFSDSNHVAGYGAQRLSNEIMQNLTK